MNKLLCVAIFGCCLLSCKKNAPSASPFTGSISATVNGAPIAFNAVAEATLGNPGNQWYLDIGGDQAAAVPTGSIDIFIAGGPAAITAGVYPVTGHKVLITYYPANGGEYQNDTTASTGQPVLTITSVNFSSVQGTFSGTLNPVPGSSSVSAVNITNGKFDVNVQQ
jgi:hypothetical protein